MLRLVRLLTVLFLRTLSCVGWIVYETVAIFVYLERVTNLPNGRGVREAYATSKSFTTLSTQSIWKKWLGSRFTEEKDNWFIVQKRKQLIMKNSVGQYACSLCVFVPRNWLLFFYRPGWIVYETVAIFVYLERVTNLPNGRGVREAYATSKSFTTLSTQSIWKKWLGSRFTEEKDNWFIVQKRKQLIMKNSVGQYACSLCVFVPRNWLLFFYRPGKSNFSLIIGSLSKDDVDDSENGIWKCNLII